VLSKRSRLIDFSRFDFTKSQKSKSSTCKGFLGINNVIKCFFFVHRLPSAFVFPSQFPLSTFTDELVLVQESNTNSLLAPPRDPTHGDDAPLYCNAVGGPARLQCPSCCEALSSSSNILALKNMLVLGVSFNVAVHRVCVWFCLSFAIRTGFTFDACQSCWMGLGD
jgi:hypothetical protein